MELRARVLFSAPLCRMCIAEGRIGEAVEVDHIDGDYRNNDLTNLQGLCKAHHLDKTLRAAGKRVATGAGLDGLPSDPSHHWNK